MNCWRACHQLLLPLPTSITPPPQTHTLGGWAEEQGSICWTAAPKLFPGTPRPRWAELALSRTTSQFSCAEAEGIIKSLLCINLESLERLTSCACFGLAVMGKWQNSTGVAVAGPSKHSTTKSVLWCRLQRTRSASAARRNSHLHLLPL